MYYITKIYILHYFHAQNKLNLNINYMVDMLNGRREKERREIINLRQSIT